MGAIPRPHVFQDLLLRIWWATHWNVHPGWRHSRPFRRPFTNVWYVLDGSMGVRLDQRELTIVPQTLMVVPPGVTLDNWNSGPGRLEYLSLGFECILGGIDIFYGRAPAIRHVALPGEVVDLWKAIERETDALLERNTLKANLRLAGYARLWWSEMVEYIGGDAVQAVVALDPRVGQALEWLRRNLHTDVRADDVAKMLHISQSYLRQLFSDSLGMSFRQTLIHLRLQRAKQLLMSTDLTVAEVARKVGYTSPHHFTRVFTAHEGESPIAFRRVARGARTGAPAWS